MSVVNDNLNGIRFLSMVLLNVLQPTAPAAAAAAAAAAAGYCYVVACKTSVTAFSIILLWRKIWDKTESSAWLQKSSR